MRAVLAGLIFALFALCAAPEARANCVTPCTKAQITTDINTNWPDNTAQQITPALLRSTVLDLVNSYVDVNGASTFTCTTHQFLVSIATLSSFTCAQPVLGDVSGFGAGVATSLALATNAVGGFPTVPVPVAQGGTGDTGTAWTAFTPSPTCGTGTITTNSARSKTLGKTTFMQVEFTITVIGTCGNTLSFNLPMVAQSGGALAGEEITAGKGVMCRLTAGAGTGGCVKTDVSAYLVNDHFVASGVFENQ